MKAKALALFAAEACLLCGCAMLRFSGNSNPELQPNWVWSTGELEISTRTAAALPESLPDTLYYADLGPDAIDVSSYPAEQQAGFVVFK